MAKFTLENWNGKEVIQMKNDAVASALYKGASHILNEANRIAPKDEGILTQTSDVDVDPEAGTASIFYTQKYARRLHENPQYNFRGGRQGKWLEKTMMAEVDRVRDMMAKEIKGKFG